MSNLYSGANPINEIFVLKMTKSEKLNLSLYELTADGDGRLDRVRVHRLRRLVQAHRVVQLQVLHVLKKGIATMY